MNVIFMSHTHYVTFDHRSLMEYSCSHHFECLYSSQFAAFLRVNSQFSHVFSIVLFLPLQAMHWSGSLLGWALLLLAAVVGPPGAHAEGYVGECLHFVFILQRKTKIPRGNSIQSTHFHPECLRFVCRFLWLTSHAHTYSVFSANNVNTCVHKYLIKTTHYFGNKLKRWSDEISVLALRMIYKRGRDERGRKSFAIKMPFSFAHADVTTC